MTIAVEPKKFSIDYVIPDESGNQIGPPQHFEADTQKELLELVASAHKNAAKEMFKEKKARKIGDLITPDPEKPVQRFERKMLSADERIRIAAALKDPQTSPEAIKTLIENELGASSESIRQALQYTEVRQRIEMAQQQTDLFLSNHPEYVQCDSNQEMILKWLEKRNYAITRKNLELAYEDLGDLLTRQVKVPVAAPEPTPQSSLQVPTVATPVEQVTPVTPAPPQPEAIPLAVTPAPAITETPAEVRPRVSSSGLGRSDGSATPSVTPPKVAGITPQQIAKMTSNEFNERLKDPAFRKMVDEMR